MSRITLQKYTARLMAVLLCLILILSMAPIARAAESGTCGDNLTWTLADGTLTITGSGPMANYSEDSPAPWYTSRSQILKLSLSDGITRIGTWAFADCVNLASVSIPGSVEVIDDSAFRRCTGLTMLTLNDGVHTIGTCAFEKCAALADLRLPETLVSIGNNAFYMCSSLTYVTIPGGVRSIGSGVFAYCTSLIRADVDAAVTMPGWSFYGCDNLQVVSVNGASVNPESLKVINPPQGIPGYIPDEEDDTSYEEPEPTTAPAATEPAVAPDAGKVSTETITTDGNGDPVHESTSVNKTDNSTIIINNQTPVGGDMKTEISSTVHNDDGWQEVVNKVNTVSRGNEETLDVTVYSPNSDTISAGILEQLAGKDVNLTVQTQSGSQFTLDCTQLDEKIKKDLVLSYTLALAEDVPEALTGCVVYRLNFHESASIVTEMIIRLPGEHAFQTASLYQLKGWKGPELLQSVMVDGSNNAHWYLRSVDKKTDYLIGINVPGAVVDTPIIPAELHNVYKVENVYDGVEYVVTGRSSSWGVGLGQVMGILAAVMVGVIVLVGLVMFIWNKKRMQAGYVPQWDDDDDYK